MPSVEVKGSGLKATQTYIQEKYPQQYDEWVANLPTESKKLYTQTIKTTQWYPVMEAFNHPLQLIAEMFFGGDVKRAGIDIGRFSSGRMLTGVYKVFLLTPTPKALMRAARRVIALYYKGVDVEVLDLQEKSIKLQATQVSPGNPEMDYRTIGWCIRALELANCKNVQYEDIEAKDPSMFAVKLYWE